MSVGVVNKQTGDRIPTAGMQAIDDALDLTSVNPVQNAIVTAALANKQDKTDNSLQTTDKTVVGAINEHEGDISSLMSGLTDLSEEVNGDATVYPYADVITIEDAVPANLADCSVKIEPVQDLHGYDKPWVGGAGKNKLPLVLADIKAANTYGTWSGNAYTVNGVTFTVNTDNDSNVTSIIVNGTATSNTYFDFVSVFNSSEFAGMIYNGSASNNAVVRVSRSDRVTKQDLFNGDTVANSGNNLKIAIRVANAITINNEIFRPMIRLATETDATFAPYTNICPITGHTEASVEVTDGDETTKTCTIALGDTIYGGTVDFDSGVMTVTHAVVDMGTLTWAEQGNPNTYQAQIRDMLTPTNDLLCSEYAAVDYSIIADNMPDKSVKSYGSSSGRFFYLKDSSYADATEVTTALDGVQLYYPLATPTTIQLTPQQIQLLKGTNTLTASTGDISVTVNGVSGAIGQVQEQVNGLAEDVAELAKQLPDAPTTDGAYVLTVTVADGTPTYSWESAT